MRRSAPRYTHPNNQRPRTNPYKTWTLHLMFCVINIMALLYYVGGGGVEPRSPPANTTLATCNATMTHHERFNGGAERCSPPKTPTITTVRSPAPRQCHFSDYSVNVTHDSAKEPHQQRGLHPVLNVTPLSLHFSQRLQTRNCRNTASSHRSSPPSPTHLAWHCRSVIVSGAGPPVCLPATGSLMGIKHALHHLTPHLPPPHHQRLLYQGQPLGDNDTTPTSTAHGPIHMTLRLVGLKGGGRRSRRDTDTDSTSGGDSDSHSRRKKSRKRSSKGELTRARRAMMSLADLVAGICQSIQQPPQPVTAETSAPRMSTNRHGSQHRDPTESQQCEPEPPQPRRRYCVNIDTRQGERQVLLHDPGYQPQPPAPPPTPLAEPLRFYRKPQSPEVPCAVLALQHGHRDMTRQPPPLKAAPHMEPTVAQPAPYYS